MYRFTNISPLTRQYLIVIASNLSTFTFGMGFLWTSPMLVKLTDENDPVLSRSVTEEEGSWIASTSSLLSIVFNFIVATLVDRFGRKFILICSCAPKLISCVLYITAKEAWPIILARGFEGICESITLNAVCTYVSEIASKEIRGRLGTIFQISSSLGVLAMMSIGPFASYLAVNIVYFCACFLSFIPLLLIPESPYFLYSKDRKEDALQVLTYLRDSESDAIEEMKEYSVPKADSNIDKLMFLKDKIFLKSLMIVLVLGIGVQAIGHNANVTYLQVILKDIQSVISPKLLSVVLSIVQLIASILTSFITDRFGRKPIMITTLIGYCFGMIGLAIFFKFVESGRPTTGFISWLPLISNVVITFCYSSGLGSLYWIVMSELFNYFCRAIGISASVAATSVSAFFIFKNFFFLVDWIGKGGVFFLFTGNTLLFAIFITLVVPETKRKTYEEIQKALGAKKKCDAVTQS